MVLLGKKLGISQEFAESIEIEVKGEIYNDHLKTSLDDNKLTEQESKKLDKLRNILDLDEEKVSKASEKTAIEGYRRLFKKFENEGIVNVRQLKELDRLAKTSGMSPSKAAKVAVTDAQNLYKRTITMICQDKVVTESEKELIEELEHLLKLPRRLIDKHRNRLVKVQQIQAIHEGDLPRVENHNMHLKSTEICHWHEKTEYSYQTSTKTKSLKGNLTVTNRRVLFTAPERSFQFRYKNILNINACTNSVKLTLNHKQGQGDYFTSKPKILAAVIETLVRGHDFQHAANMDEPKTRHLCDEVKVTVWKRDGGKCVKCGAHEYLEFDHIIVNPYPLSRPFFPFFKV